MKTRVETRICYIGSQLTATYVAEFRGNDWVDGTPEGVTNYPWLLDHNIVWIEQRVVYEPEPWEVVDLDEYLSGPEDGQVG